MEADVRSRSAAMKTITDDWVAQLGRLRFASPVTHVYNPLVYARQGYDAYVRRFGSTAKPIILLGMNPGPYGMVQTGVPFGDVTLVTEWMGLRAEVGQPAQPHPKRPVLGYACPRREVSGARLWGWARQRYGTPEAFFERILVLNYCPLAFMERSGRNRTPDRLPVEERNALFACCDRALRRTMACYAPRWVVGVGRFAQQRAAAALAGMRIRVAGVAHPSPANPKANRGWAALMESALTSMGIALPD